MGRALIRAIAETPGAVLTGALEAPGSELLGQDSGLLAGLPAKGAIAVGRDADLVAFAPDAGGVVDPARLHHRHPVTPYAGVELRGEVRRVWLRGEAPGAGECLAP